MINDRSEGDNSSFNKDKIAEEENDAIKQEDHNKRGSAITFFDDSDNENDQGNKTLDRFKRPSKRDWSPGGEDDQQQ